MQYGQNRQVKKKGQETSFDALLTYIFIITHLFYNLLEIWLKPLIFGKKKKSKNKVPLEGPKKVPLVGPKVFELF